MTPLIREQDMVLSFIAYAIAANVSQSICTFDVYALGMISRNYICHDVLKLGSNVSKW